MIACMWCAGWSCTSKPAEKKIHRAFYYWKSVFHISPAEADWLDSLQVNTLYVRYFDVAWDATTQQPVPLAPLRPGRGVTLENLPQQIIPTVFITNETMLRMSDAQIPALAEDILQLISSTHTMLKAKPSVQIQIDCDWNATSKSRYFALLEKLQQLDSTRTYSATIRLHQLKYANATGVPPVSRGLLMCYNMGNIKSIETRNSILDPQEVQRYTTGFSTYALPVDVAFPLFGWAVLFRNQQYAGLLQLNNPNAIAGISEKTGNNSYRVLKDTTLFGYALMKDDLLRIESSEVQDILQAASLLQGKFSNDSFSVSLYHLDTVILNKYTTHELEAVYHSLR